MSKQSQGDQTFGQWLSAQMAACGFTTNMALERKTGIDNTTISRWRGDLMTPGMDQLRKLEEPLKTPLLQLLIRAGYVSPEEARVRRMEPLPSAETGHQSSADAPSVGGAGDRAGTPSLTVVPSSDEDEEDNEVLAAVLRDPYLDDDAKSHYVNQYELLREMSARRRAAQQDESERLPYVAHGKQETPVDPEEEERIEEIARETRRQNPETDDEDVPPQ